MSESNDIPPFRRGDLFAGGSGIGGTVGNLLLAMIPFSSFGAEGFECSCSYMCSESVLLSVCGALLIVPQRV